MNAHSKSSSGPGGKFAARYHHAGTLLLTCLFLIVSIVAAITHLTEGYRETVATSRHRAQMLVMAFTNRADHIFGETIVGTAGIADLYWDQLRNRTVDINDIDRIMAGKLKTLPQVGAFLLIAPNGKVIADASNFPLVSGAGILPTMPALIPPAGRNTSFVGNPVNGIDGDDPGHWFLPVGISVGEDQTAPSGFAVALVDLHAFDTFYRAIDAGYRGRVLLWTADGYLAVASQNEPRKPGDFDPSMKRVFSTQIRPLYRGEGRVDGPSQDDPAIITAESQVDALPLMGTVELNSRDYLREWRGERNRLALAIIGIDLGIVALAGIILSQLQRTRQNEEALRNAKATAEEANAAKSRFLAHMSHEFRTPLNAIMGFSDIIQSKTMGEPLAPVYASYANHIYRSGEHLLEIVNEILDMSKIESGIPSLQREVMDINVVVERAVAFLERMASAAHLEVRRAIAAELPRIVADERFVRQVLINLLSNAIKFSPAGSTVTVRVTVTRGESLDCSVIDHGPGIEPMILSRIGEPFLQGNPTLSRTGQGTGLGLSICKHYMDLLGGTLVIDSSLGVGTIVTMRFPRSLWSGEHV